MATCSPRVSSQWMSSLLILLRIKEPEIYKTLAFWFPPSGPSLSVSFISNPPSLSFATNTDWIFTVAFFKKIKDYYKWKPSLCILYTQLTVYFRVPQVRFMFCQNLMFLNTLSLLEEFLCFLFSDKATFLFLLWLPGHSKAKASFSSFQLLSLAIQQLRIGVNKGGLRGNTQV